MISARGRGKEEGGRIKEEGGRRKEEGGRRKEEGGRKACPEPVEGLALSLSKGLP